MNISKPYYNPRYRRRESKQVKSYLFELGENKPAECRNVMCLALSIPIKYKLQNVS